MHSAIADALRLAKRRKKYAVGGTPVSAAQPNAVAVGTNPAVNQAPKAAPSVGGSTTTLGGNNPLMQPAPNPFDPANPNNAPPVAVGSDPMDQVKAMADGINKRIDSVDKYQTDALNQQNTQLTSKIDGNNSAQTQALQDETKNLNNTINQNNQAINTQLTNQADTFAKSLDNITTDNQNALQTQAQQEAQALQKANDANASNLTNATNTWNDNLNTTKTDLTNQMNDFQKKDQSQIDQMNKDLTKRFAAVQYGLDSAMGHTDAWENLKNLEDSYGIKNIDQNYNFVSNSNDAAPQRDMWIGNSGLGPSAPVNNTAAKGGRITKAFGGNAFGSQQLSAQMPKVNPAPQPQLPTNSQPQFNQAAAASSPALQKQTDPSPGDIQNSQPGYLNPLSSQNMGVSDDGYAQGGAVGKKFEDSGSIMAEEEAPPVMPDAEVSSTQHSHSWEHLPFRPYGQRWNEETQKLNSPERKDIGFYGPVSVGEGDHVASEYSRNHNGIAYPSIAANMPKHLLTQALNAARFNAPVPEESDRFAYNIAKQRLAQGRSPFYEAGRDPYPKWSPEQHWEEPAVMRDSGGAVKDALRLTRGPHAIPLHQAIARHGYDDGGDVPTPDTQQDQDIKGDVQFAPDQNAFQGAVSAAPPGAAMPAPPRESTFQKEMRELPSTPNSDARQLNVGKYQQSITPDRMLDIVGAGDDQVSKIAAKSWYDKHPIDQDPTDAEFNKEKTESGINQPVDVETRIASNIPKGTATVVDPEGRKGSPLFVAGTTPQGENVPLNRGQQAALSAHLARLYEYADPESRVAGVTTNNIAGQQKLPFGLSNNAIGFKLGRSNVEYSLPHEVGHAIHNYQNRADNPLEGADEATLKEFAQMAHDRWKSDYKGKDLKDAAYTATPQEKWAEGMKAYLNDPQMFKLLQPNAAKFMRGIVNTDPRINKLLMLSRNEQAQQTAAHGGVIEDALRSAKNRRGFATDGAVEGDVKFAPDEVSQQKFLKENLKGSAPQYDPEGGMNTAKEAGRFVAGLTTPGAVADAAGYLGGPSIRENIGQGNYGTAALQAAGAVPVLGPLAKAGMGAHLAMSMVPKAMAVEDALKAAKGDSELLNKIRELPQLKKIADKRNVDLAIAAQHLGNGVTPEMYQDLVNQLNPVRPYESVPTPATVEDLHRGLSANKREKIGKGSEIPEGYPVGSRLDIPAYTINGVWAPTIHDMAGKTATTIAHEPVVRLSNPVFVVPHKNALNVAQGANKAPFATINGGWVPTTAEEAHAMATEYLNHPEWRQVGMDPTRHSYFYDRHTQEPITHAEEAIQVGPLVLAKNPKYGKRSDHPFSSGGEVEDALRLARKKYNG
jgi:hypothetical protein